MKELGSYIFSSDKCMIKFLNSPINEKDDYLDYVMVRRDDSWRIHSHFIGIGNYIEDLKRDLNLHKMELNRSSLCTEESEESLFNILKMFDEYICYMMNRYVNMGDIDELSRSVLNLFENESVKYNEDFQTFRNDPQFEEKYLTYLNRKEIKEHNMNIDSIL